MAAQKATGFIIYRRKASKRIEYLFLQASYKPYHWTPPKGHMDFGEDEITTAYRETEEEAGLTKDHLKVHLNFQVILIYLVRGNEKMSKYWLAELLDPETPIKISDEHQEYKWLDLDNVPKYIEFEDMLNALKNSQKFIQDLHAK